MDRRIDGSTAQEGPPAPVLSVRGLRTSFRSGGWWRPVVHGVDLDVLPGETVALVGESGSGKSVTSLAVMRLHDERSTRIEGRVELEGVDLLALRREEMARIRGDRVAMIFQEPMTSLNPIFTVGSQIAEVMVLHRGIGRKEARDETFRLLEKVRIPNARARLDEYPHQFSGGMRQRVMIAMALASRPRLLIADEPTTALDVTIQGQILDLIKTLQDEEGTSVLFITHDMGVVAEIADRTVVMYKGDVVESGPTTEIFRSPRRPYTRALLSAVPRLGSMQGRAWPARFPVVDATSGVALEEEEVVGRDRSDAPILQVSGLVTRFPVRKGILSRAVGAVHAVEDVGFDLHRGETLSLVGESGCGKSTTGRSILRLVTPAAGTVRIAGVDVSGIGAARLRDVRRDIQMIFQDPFASLNPRMRIGHAICEAYLEHGLGTRDAARGKASRLLGRVGLGDDAMSRFPHEFSGGQRQRLCIARALMLDPKVIIADEAVSALDVSVKAQVCNLLLDLQRELDLAYLFISHDMAVVERVSHRVAVMKLGEIVEIGPRSSVFENPNHPYTRKLMASVPVPDPDRRHLRRRFEVEELRNPVRPVGYDAPKRLYREVGPGHLVMVD